MSPGGCDFLIENGGLERLLNEKRIMLMIS